MAWTFHPDATAFERGLDFAAGDPVKRNRQRTVLHVAGPAGGWFVKFCRLDGLRAWVRDLVRGPKARLEFANAAELRRRGIPAVEPVAWRGTRTPGASAIVTRAVTGAEPLDAVLERLAAADRRPMAVALGRYFRQLSDAGVRHPDPHPGNFLVARSATGWTFTLLDLHAIRIGELPTDAAIVENLVLVNRWFALRASRADRLRFLSAFGRPDLARAIEAGTARSNLLFWQRRFGRYAGSNREFRRLPGGVAWVGAPAEFVDAFRRDPESFFRDATPIKHSKSSTVVRHTIAGFGDVILKRVPVRSRLGRLKDRLRPSGVLRSWRFGQSLIDRFLPTPRPLVVLSGPVGYLAVAAVPGAVTLHEWVGRRPDRRRMIAFAATLGRVLRTMHDRGITHRDLKSSNVLVDAADRPWLIDLVGASSRLAVPAATRQRDLARLAVSFLDSTTVTNGLRRSFLAGYGCDWRAWWQAIGRRATAKAARNRRRGRVVG